MPAIAWYMIGGGALLGGGAFAISETTKAAIKVSLLVGVAYILTKKGGF